MRKLITFVALIGLALVARQAAAQTSLTADRIYLGATGCAMRTGSGTPTGGTSCDFYFDTATGHVWINHGGTWIDVSTRTPTFTSVTSATVSATTSVTTPTVAATTKVTTPLVDATANLQLAPAGDLLLAPAGRDVMPGANYTVNLGALEDKYLTLHAAELWVETLVAQSTMATIGGRVLVAPTNILSADLTAAATNITVKYNNLLNGDIVYMESNGRVEFMAVASNVTGTAGAYTYGVTRNLDGSGANVWNAGDALLNTGTTGKGFLDLYSLSGVLSGTGPTMVGNVRTGTAYNAIAPRFAVGNLDGLYGHGANSYGFAAGNPAGAYVYLDDNNGLVMGGPTGVKVQVTPAGDATFAGTINAAAGLIGGWTIDANQLYKQTGALYSGMHAGPSSNVRFYAGGSAGNVETAPFRVYADGSVVMTSAVITAPNAGSGGAALNADADTRDIGLWANCAGACVITNIPDGKVGAWSLRSVAGVAAVPVETRRIPFDPNKTYRFHVWARAGGGANGVLYVGLSAYDATGSECDINGCPTAGTRYFYCAVGETGTTLATWKEFNCNVGAGTTVPIPAAMRSVSVQALMNIGGGTAGWFELQDIRLEEVAPSTLIKDGAITTAKITAGSVTSAKLASGSGTNQVRNSECRYSLEEWSNYTESGSFTPGISLGSPWQLNDEPGTCYAVSGSTTPGTHRGFTGRIVPAEAGKQYEASAYLANLWTVDDGFSHVYLAFLNDQNAIITIPVGNPCSGQGTTGKYLYGYCRSFVIATAPAGTVAMQMYILQLHQTAQTAAYMIFTRAFLAEAKPNQTEPSEWTPAGLTEITGGIIKTDTIDARAIQAGAITAGKIAAGAITADKIAANSLTAAQIATDAITADELAANAVNSAKIQAGSITADKLNVTALSAITANLGTVTAGNLSAVAINGGTIDGTTIRGVTITASSTITGGSISGGSITGVSITGSSISAGSGYVTIDANGISVSNGAASAFGRIKLGGVELWGDGTALITGSGFNAPGLLINGDSRVTGFARMEGNASVTGVLTTSNYVAVGGNLQFQGDQQTNYWPNGFPPTGAGGQMGFVNGCRCLAMLSSSVRFKENLRAWTAPDPLAILALPLYRFDFKDAPGVIPSKDHVGFIVEDLVNVAPDAVQRDDAGQPLSFYSDTLNTYLLAALKAVNARITRTEELESRVQELERQVAALVARKGGHE